MTALPGIFTRVLAFLHRRPKSDPALVRSIREREALADELGLPDEWLICPFCQAQGWRFPPHGLEEPCPLVAKAAEEFGLKTDAERMLAVRLGIANESIADLMRRAVEGEQEEE